MKRPLATLKAWFMTEDKPMQSEFWDWLDSFWHKDDKLPISSVENLGDVLNGKANTDHKHVIGDVNSLQDKLNALQTELDSLKKITSLRGNVDTHADLLLLDTSTMRDGDSYIVEADETREGLTTVYAWAKVAPGYWVFTGEWGGGSGTDTNLGNTDQFLTGDRSVDMEKRSLIFKSIIEGFQYRRFVLSLNERDDLTGDEKGLLLDFASGIEGYGNNTMSIKANGYELAINFTHFNPFDENPATSNSLFSIIVDAKGINFKNQFGALTNKFLWVDEYGTFQFLTIEEFKAKLGI